MKRVWLPVFATAALAVGWIGGNGLASSSAAKADALRPAEIAALSFPNDAGILASWQKVQETRRKRLQENREIAGKIETQKNEIRRVQGRLIELNAAIEEARRALDESPEIERDLAWKVEAERLIGNLEDLKRKIKDRSWKHKSAWEEVMKKLEGFDNLTFDAKILLRGEVTKVKTNYDNELAKAHKQYSDDFKELKTEIEKHLADPAHTPP